MLFLVMFVLLIVFAMGLALLIEFYDFKSIFLGIVLIGFSLFVGYKVISYVPPKEFQLESTTNIYALEDNFTIRGSRFYLEEDNRYYYLADYKDGKKMSSISKNNSYVVEQDGVQPKIEVYKEVNIGNGVIDRLYKDIFLETEYKIIVPKETLTNEFNVDMKK